MAKEMKNTYVSMSKIAGALVAMLLIIQSPHLLAEDPPENIRFEDGVLRWDAVDDAISYNIYVLSAPVNGNGFYAVSYTHLRAHETLR